MLLNRILGMIYDFFILLMHTFELDADFFYNIISG